MLSELQSIADSLAARLRRSVAIDDTRMRLLVHTPHRGESVDSHRVESIMQKQASDAVEEWVKREGIAKATGPVRLASDENLGAVARLCVPIRCQGILLAYLWLLEADGQTSDGDIELAEASASAAGEVLFRARLLVDLHRGRERELTRDLIAADASVRVHASQQLVANDMLVEGATVTAIVAQVLSPTDATLMDAIDLALQKAARHAAPLRTLSSTIGGSAGVLLVSALTSPTTTLLRHVGTELRQSIVDGTQAEVSVEVGIGATVYEASSANNSYSCARDAIRVGSCVPGFSPVSAWSDLGIYKLLVQMPLDELTSNAIPAGLVKLIGEDESGVLLETLEVYLDEAGRVPPTIDRLKLHRTSLYYRLRKIERVSGSDLGSGADRLALHLGIKLNRLLA